MNKMKKVMCYIITMSFFMTVITYGIYGSAASVVSGTNIEDKNLKSFVETVMQSMGKGDYSFILKNTDNGSGSNPVIHNINGNGLDGIDRQPKYKYSDEEILSNIRRYVINLFGETSWENVTYKAETTYGSDSQMYWVDKRDNQILDVKEYTTRRNIYLKDALSENNNEPDVSKIKLPFDKFFKPDPNQFIVKLSFDDCNIAATGEGEFYFIIRREADQFRIYESFQWGTVESKGVCDTKNPTYAKLSDNSAALPQQVNELIKEFIFAVNNDKIDWLAEHISDQNCIWFPDNKKEYDGIKNIITDQINCYKTFSNQTNLKYPSVYASKIDCLNDLKFCKEVWFDTVSNEFIDSGTAEKKNNDYIKNKCMESGIPYDSEKGITDISSEEYNLLIDNEITSEYYPVQPVGTFVNRYSLYKVSLFFDDLQNENQKYYSFYISDQSGEYSIISSFFYENTYDCGISVQNRGD